MEHNFSCLNGHSFPLDIPDKKLQWFLDLCKKGKRVCPHCKPENVEINLVVPKGQDEKRYACRHEHSTTAYAFKNGWSGIEWGKGFGDHENFQCSPTDLEAKIDAGELKCRVLKENGKPCNCKLRAVDKHDLAVAQGGFGIKTKVRVGDIWAKNKVPDPVDTKSVDVYEHGIHHTVDVRSEHAERNKARLEHIRKKNRVSKPQGEVLNKPTSNRYSSGQPNKEKVMDES